MNKEIKEPTKDELGLTVAQQKHRLAAMLDGKKMTVLPKYITNKSKAEAEQYSADDRLYLLAINWDKYN